MRTSQPMTPAEQRQLRQAYDRLRRPGIVISGDPETDNAIAVDELVDRPRSEQ